MMEGNGIGPRGATAIADMLAVNNDMTVLVLQCNNVGDKGAAALAEALRVNRSLQVLGLPINLITSAGASRLGAMLGKNKVLRVLSLKHNAIRDVAEIASGLASNRHLEGLNLRCGGALPCLLVASLDEPCRHSAASAPPESGGHGAVAWTHRFSRGRALTRREIAGSLIAAHVSG